MKITEALTINGPGIANLTIDGQFGSRIFNIDGPGLMPVAISKMKLTNGMTTGGTIADRGGAIFILDEVVSLTDMEFASNQTVGARGGAVNLQFNSGVLTITNCLFTNNISGLNGGAVHSDGGSLVINSSTFTLNTANNSGGAVYVAGGNLTMNDSSLSGNTATLSRGGAVYFFGNSATITNSNFDKSIGSINSSGTQGGAIALFSGTLNMNGGSIIESQAMRRGGAIYCANLTTANISGVTITGTMTVGAGDSGGAIAAIGSKTTIQDCVITGCLSSLRGGGIYGFFGATVNVLRTEVSGCSSSGSVNGGGGISIQNAASALIQDCTITGNTSPTRGGGIYANNTNITIERCFIADNNAGTMGGGIALVPVNNNVVQTVRHSTIFNNVSAGKGGGISVYLGYGIQRIQNCTIAGNTANGSSTTTTGGGLSRDFFGAGQLQIESTIIADNIGVGGGPDIMGTLTANNSLIENTANGTVTGTGNVLGLDPGLAMPNLNGGLTKTMLPANPGPAINSGSNISGQATDQRGLPRVAGVQADIGAVEIPSPGIPTASTALTEVTAYGGATYEIAVAYADDTGFDTTKFDGNDLLVTGPNSFSQLAKLKSISGGGTNYLVTYTITPPSGTWNQNDLGLYKVAIQAGEVVDDGGNPLPAATLGNFVVDGRTYVVLNNANTGPGSLRQGLINANSFPSTDTITFDPSIFGQTITVTSTLPISSALSINGPGTDKITVSGGGTVRVFLVDAPARPTVNISGLTIANGLKTGSATTDRGAGVFVIDEVVNLTNIVFNNNRATGSRGGAVAGASPSIITITGSTFTNNQSLSFGGAVHSFGGTVNVIDSTFANNNPTSATGAGGAINIDTGNLTVERSTFKNNTASIGGAISLTNPGASNSITIRNSTISGNTATAANGGGGISVTGLAGKLTLQNSTVAFNSSTNAGGGGGGISVISTTGAPTITVDSTIVAKNNGTTGPDIKGTVNVANYSWFGDPNGHTIIAPVGVQNGDPLLQPLRNNGGPTETHALDPLSLAVNAGKNVTTPALTVDQRGTGFARDINGVDIGAFEVNPTTVKATATNVNQAGATLYTFTVTYTDALGLDASTLGDADILVTGPNSFSQFAKFVSVTPTGNGDARTATYSIVPPGVDMAWDLTDSGEYTISLELDQVKNTAGTSFLSGPLTTFRVGVPQTLVVTNLNDDNSPGSLRAVLQTANDNFPSLDTITFDSALNGTIKLALGGLTISDSVSIMGGGKITIDGDNLNRILTIDDVQTTVQKVTLTGLTLTQGNSDKGGAIFVANEDVTLENCVVSTSKATDAGGGIFVDSDGVLTIRNSTVSGNQATGANAQGGGVYFFADGDLTVENSTVSGNSTTNEGGGIYFYGVPTDNTITIRNSTISGNSAGVNGGGLAFLFAGNVLIQNSTVAFNNAGTGFGGGIAQLSISGLITIESSIVAKNTNQFAPDVGAGVTANFSLIGDTFGGFVSGGNNLVNVDPLLDTTLTNNGGPTATHRLLVSSPAINQGSNPAAVTVDQRGFERSVGQTDIGAYEFQLPRVTTVQVNDGSGQRSMVTSLVVTFSEPVNFTGGLANAFTLARYAQGGAATVGLTFSPSSGPASQVTITFNNSNMPLDPAGSLQDGQYRLTINSANVGGVDGNLDGNNNQVADGSPADDSITQFHRLFGDGNGDGIVNASDFNSFRLAYGSPGPSIYDFDGIGGVNAADFNAFRLRYGSSGFLP